MTEEKKFTIPLRREFLKAPKWKRSPRAIRAIKKFIQRHLKVEDVKIGKALNEKIWSRSSKNPPGKINVVVKKEEKKAYVELEGVKIPEEKKEKKGVVEKVKEKIVKKKEVEEEKKEEKVKETSKEESKEKK